MSTLRCPRCTFTLVPHRLPGAMLDTCPRCRGAFVEHGEDDGLFGVVGALESWRDRGVATFVGRGRLHCPVGPGPTHGPMDVWRVDVPGDRPIEVDSCGTCRGLWLDGGEAARLTGSRGALSRRTAAVPTAPRADDAGPLNEPPPGQEKTSVGWYLFQLFTSVPVEVYNPRRRPALACLALLVACVVVFVFEVGAIVSGDASFTSRWGAVPATMARGEHLASIVTYMFLHGGVLHLVGNAWFLWTFGDNVEDRIGRLRFLALFTGCGVAGFALHALLTSSPQVPLVGASGAIAGLMGAYLALFPRAQLYQVVLFIRFKVPVRFYVGGWAALNVLLGMASLGPHGADGDVAWWCHVGGFVSGLGWAKVAGRRFRDGAELEIRGS